MKSRKRKKFSQNPWHLHKVHFGTVNIQDMEKTILGYVKKEMAKVTTRSSIIYVQYIELILYRLKIIY